MRVREEENTHTVYSLRNHLRSYIYCILRIMFSYFSISQRHTRFISPLSIQSSNTTCLLKIHMSDSLCCSCITVLHEKDKTRVK